MYNNTEINQLFLTGVLLLFFFSKLWSAKSSFCQLPISLYHLQQVHSDQKKILIFSLPALNSQYLFILGAENCKAACC